MPSQIAVLWLNAFPITGWLGIDHFVAGDPGAGAGKLFSNLLLLGPVWNFIDFLTLVFQDRLLGANIQWSLVSSSSLTANKIYVSVFHMVMLVLLIVFAMWLTIQVRAYRKTRKCMSC